MLGADGATDGANSMRGSVYFSAVVRPLPKAITMSKKIAKTKGSLGPPIDGRQCSYAALTSRIWPAAVRAGAFSILTRSSSAS